MEPQKNGIKDETKILIMLAFFSISMGLWRNFRELWLQANNMNVSEISSLLSVGTFISAILIFISAKTLKLDKIKGFITGCLLFNSINMFIMFLINGSNNINLIRASVILNILLEKFVIISIYPLITTIQKTDNIYSKRKLVEYLFRDIGILVGGIFIGRTIFNLNVDYNICLSISLLFMLIATLVIANSKIKSSNKKSEISFKFILKDKILITYLITYFIGTTAMNTGLGLKMLMLTNQLNFSPSGATNYLLIIGLLADLVGILALKFLTPKNDYITITIKFGIRLALYTLAFLSNSIILVIIAISWSILISTAFENKTDGIYINRVDTKYQLFFSDMRFVIGIFAESLGLLFAGILFEHGIRYILGLSALFVLPQLSLSYLMIYMRHKEDKKI
ncbi:MAG: hypothetical protein IJE59_00110 [Clostridia bacterium]|nr:hypothetical protein [Clostridia bacterium]